MASHLLLPLELGERQHPVPRMLALWIAEHLDLIEQVLPCVFAAPVGPAPDPLALEEVEEALGDCVVLAVAAAAHRMLKAVGAQE